VNTAESAKAVERKDRVTLLEGDAFDLLRALPAESVDLLITSPPYWGLRTYGQTHNWDTLALWKERGNDPEAAPPYSWYRENGGLLGLEPMPEWYVAHLVEILAQAKKAIRSTGSVWINLGDTYFARWSSIRDAGRQGLGSQVRERRRTPMGGVRQEKQLLLIPHRFAMAMQQERWILRNDLVWFKPNVPPRPEKDRLRLSHEHFFHFVKRPKEGRARYYYDLASAEPSQNDVVVCGASRGEEGHAATFPLPLILPRIATSCPPGGMVLDPFCGTGRALVAAKRLGRRAIGMDIVPSFLRTAELALRQEALALA
jgi:site-specific DNA-methyltransferase (cytosine-N4-specific)